MEGGCLLKANTYCLKASYYPNWKSYFKVFLFLFFFFNHGPFVHYISAGIYLSHILLVVNIKKLKFRFIFIFFWKECFLIEIY